jgi:tetratricopeptide (TPR) repeat protein
MSKHRQGKHMHKTPAYPASPKTPPPVKEKTQEITTASTSLSLTKKMGAFIFLLSLVLYAQTLKFGFTFDDRLVVFENTQTMQGIKAIPEIFTKPYRYGSVVPDDKLYRPVSKAIYALCWSISQDNPLPYHFANLLLFAITSVLLFLTLARYFPEPLLPFIISLLFVTHPIHTEVVCNIKSMDEILSLLFFIVSAFFIHTYLTTHKFFNLVLAAIAFFFSFLSKESGITFLAVIPLMAYFANADKKEILRTAGVILLVAILVIAIRMMVLSLTSANPVHDADNILAGTNNFIIQRATAIYLLGKYFLLLIYPHPLVCDYSAQQISLVNAGNVYFILSFLFFGSCLLYSIWLLRKKDWIAFGILFFFITFSVTCNIFFISGSHFAERFLYTPSLGFCIVTGLLLDRHIDTKNKSVSSFSKAILSRPLLMSIVLLIALLYSIKTIRQNPVWKDNISLFENGIKYSPKSYRMHLSLASDLTDEKYIKQFPKEIQNKLYERAIGEIKTSLTYYNDIDAYDMLGNIFYVNLRYDSALYYYQMGLQFRPDYENLNFHVGKAFDKLSRYDDALPYLYKALGKNPKNDGVLYNLALSYTNKNSIDSGLHYFLKVIELRPNGPDAFYYAGLIYRAKGDSSNAKEFLDKANALGGPRE